MRYPFFMYHTSPPCPFCQQIQPVVYWGKNESKTRRFRCKDCDKTFTTSPKSNRITAEKEALIGKLLEERLSVEAIARATNSAKRTVYNVLKKRLQLPPTSPTPPSTENTMPSNSTNFVSARSAICGFGQRFRATQGKSSLG